MKYQIKNITICNSKTEAKAKFKKIFDSKIISIIETG